ncbi:peptidoglycan-binding domain-containing protein [Leucobacter japonicus]|uniref:peptidoglycan-binding domain-containing protein n=1 Tax=Leucobacter japonicus TaxID=1461259 RepID=UPI000A81686A|nr:peptidoglycan-binding protein [Leucobacter japonicus]
MTKKFQKSFRMVALAGVVLAASTALTAAPVSAAQAAPASACVSNLYSSGGVAPCIKNLQILANHKLPYITGQRLVVDGQFGPATRAGIVAIQKKFGLAQDGVVGAKTWRTLCSPSTIAPYAGEDFTAAEAVAARNAGC